MNRSLISVSTRNEEVDSDNGDDQPPPIVPKLPFRELYSFKCEFSDCNFTSRTYEAMDTHVEKKHNCQHCGRSYFNLKLHFCTMHGQRGGHVGPPQVDQSFFVEISRSHRGTVIKYEHTVEEAVQVFDDIYSFMNYIYKPLTRLLQEHIRYWSGIVVVYRQHTELQDLKTGEQVYKYLGTNSMTIRHKNYIEGAIHFITTFLLAQLELYNSNGSGYKITAIENALVSIGEYRPIRPRGYIATPIELKRRQGLLNIRGNDGYCFKYCVTANFYKDEVERVATMIRKLDNQPITGKAHSIAIKRILEDGKNYEKFFDKFDWSGLDFPIDFDDINTFERNNGISVNVFKNVGKDTVWIRDTALESEKHIDLLYVVDEENENAHYILIHNRSAFDGKDRKRRHYYCTFCQKRFALKRCLISHKKECFNVNLGIKEFPKQNFYEFSKLESTIRFPLMLVYDWECFVQCQNRSKAQGSGSFTRRTALLDPSGYSVALIGPEGLLFADVYDGPNAIDHFIKTALRIADLARIYIKGMAKKVVATPEDLKAHSRARTCLMCGNLFTKKRYKVLHHNHMTGNVVGSLHNDCNLKIKYKNLLPAICHNATNFDHAIIVRGFKQGNVSSVSVIPKNSEKYLGFVVDKKIKFLDSCQFLPSSLATAVASLKKSGLDKFRYTKQFFNRDEKIMDELLLSKQIYPYDYMTGPNVYNDTSLPSKEQFYDSLHDKHISDEDYAHAQRVWKEFNCNTLHDYARLYSISDTLLLADVFENFRETAFESLGLDPLYVWSSPGYSWDCWMYSSKIKLEYIKNFEMLDMLERGIRGYPTFVQERIATANNETFGEDWSYDPAKPRSRILYSDLNSLYAWCMTNKLPYKDFKMLTDDEIEQIDIMTLNPDGDTSYIFEVDLEYPEHLHDLHDDLPLAVEKKIVEVSEISPTQERLMELYSKVVKKPLGGEKLIMTLYPKKNYVTYLKTLQFYVNQGLVITKVHKGFSFTQGYILRDYILQNIEKRKVANSELVSNLHKLLNNSIFGKSLQDSSNFVDVVFCLTRQETVKQLAKPNLKSFMPLDEEITVCQLNKTKIICNNFTYLGFVILEYAKLRLYDSWYNGIKKVFGPRARVVYGDTDSIINIIEDPDNTFYSDMFKLSSWYDFSNLENDHPLYTSERKGVPGLWKIVINDPVEVVAISSKMYSVLTLDDVKQAKQHDREIAFGIYPANQSNAKKKELMKKGKGIGRGVLEKLQHSHYANTITEYNKIFQIRMQGIRQYKTILNRIELRKVGLHALDTKRFILRGGVRTLAFGNYNIKRIREEELMLSNDIDCEGVEVEELMFSDQCNLSKNDEAKIRNTAEELVKESLSKYKPHHVITIPECIL